MDGVEAKARGDSVRVAAVAGLNVVSDGLLNTAGDG